MCKNWGGGRNVDDQNVDRPKISERRNGLFSWSERRNQNVEMVFLVDQNVEKRIITTSKRVDHYYENHNVEKNEKNVESLIFVWFSHFNYLWRILTTYGVWVLWTPGVKKWIFKSSLAWLNLT